MNSELLRKQSVVFFSDIVGYTRLMGKDEDAAFQLVKDNLSLHQEIFTKYGGQVVKELGDGILGVFESPEKALHASLEIQKTCLKSGKFQLRIGLHCGEIIYDHGDVFGDAVNQSARIQSVGIPTCILISDHLYRELPPKSPFETVRIGAFELKNVEHKVELHAVTNPPLNVPKRADILKNIKYQERNPWMRWVIGFAFLILLSALVYSYFFRGTIWGKEKSVVVLPFENLSQSTSNDYFSNGLTSDIIYQLSQIDSIQVVPYDQVLGWDDTDLSLDSIKSKFDVETVLKGSIDFLGSKVQVAVRLVDLSTKKNIWSKTFVRENSGIISIQNYIAEEIAHSLNANLSAQELSHIEKSQTVNAEAYDLYLKAKNYYSKYNDQDNLQAIALFKQAVQIDPNYALAFSGLADAYSQMPSYGYGISWLDSSMDANDKALAIDPELAEAYLSKGIIYYNQGKTELAKISFEKANAYKANLSRAIGNLATIYFTQGEYNKSLQLQAKSANLNPHSFLPYQITGWIYRILGQASDSEYFLTKANEIRENPVTYEQLAYTYISDGKIPQAQNLITEVLKVRDSNSNTIAGLISFYLNELDSAQSYFLRSIASSPEYETDPYYVIPINLAYILQTQGKAKEANQLLDQGITLRMTFIQNGDEDYNLPLDLALALLIKGDQKQATTYLHMAFDLGWRDLFVIEHHPALSEYRKTSAYEEISRKIQLEIQQVKQQMLPTSLLRDR